MQSVGLVNMVRARGSKNYSAGSREGSLPEISISPRAIFSFLVQDHANRYNKLELLANGDNK
jgi:hypothetical protein